MGEGRGIYSVAMFHRQQAPPRVMRGGGFLCASGDKEGCFLSVFVIMHEITWIKLDFCYLAFCG